MQARIGWIVLNWARGRGGRLLHGSEEALPVAEAWQPVRLGPALQNVDGRRGVIGCRNRIQMKGCAYDEEREESVREPVS